jgi:hypothetical protein
MVSPSAAASCSLVGRVEVMRKWIVVRGVSTCGNSIHASVIAGRWQKPHQGRTLCDLPHKDDAKGGGVLIAIVLGLVVVIFAAAVFTVMLEDKRAAKREAVRRAARLARLGEVDPLAPHRLRTER